MRRETLSDEEIDRFVEDGSVNLEQVRGDADHRRNPGYWCPRGCPDRHDQQLLRPTSSPHSDWGGMYRRWPRKEASGFGVGDRARAKPHRGVCCTSEEGGAGPQTRAHDRQGGFVLLSGSDRRPSEFGVDNEAGDGKECSRRLRNRAPQSILREPAVRLGRSRQSRRTEMSEYPNLNDLSACPSDRGSISAWENRPA